MIVFDLKCSKSHVFEAWFSSSGAYEEQRAAGLVECPTCGSSDVSKAVMAPNVGAKSNQTVAIPIPQPADTSATASAPSVPESVATAIPEQMPAELKEAAQKFMDGMRKHVETNCDYVGNEFAEEARKIHYGEADERGIYGEASADETAELLEEGIEILPIPGVRRTDA